MELGHWYSGKIQCVQYRRQVRSHPRVLYLLYRTKIFFLGGSILLVEVDRTAELGVQRDLELLHRLLALFGVRRVFRELIVDGGQVFL